MNTFNEFIYRGWMKYSGGKGIKSKFFKKMRLALIKKNDPIIRCRINDTILRMPMSQMTPFYMKVNPNYDRQISKICELIKKNINKNISIIDVGANIGDTVINIGIRDAKYLLIEGNPKFCELIPDNLQNNYDYILEKCFLGDGDSTYKSYKVITSRGTASLSAVELDDIDIVKKNITTLDDLLQRYSFVPDILKIDTDGFDFAVLRGANKTLKNYKPYIFFEWGIKDLIENNEDPIRIWSYLYDLGYKKAYIYDNFGSLLTTINTNDYEALKCLSDYVINAKPKKIWYYDVFLFNENKENIILD